MLYEIRNYHFDPEYFEEYKKWAAEVGAPFFRKRWDVVGAWVNKDIPAKYGGSLPIDESTTPANMTWIIKWKDMSQREKAWEEVAKTKEWEELFSTVPGGTKSYLRTEAKFAEAI
jgi:hypothetical protein